ncbi:FMN-binding protein [bacterium]|nr:FMN-binding protein [bacterium]
MCQLLRRWLVVTCLLLAFPWALLADTVEFKTGASATGTIKSYAGRNVVLEVTVGTKTITRTYPRSRVKSITIDGKTFDPNNETGSAPVAGSGIERSKAEILAEIDAQGKTAPDWYESTPLDFPQTLDLTWTNPPPKPWDSSKNIGQYLWDRINPNANNWRSGIKFIHHVLASTDSNDVRRRAMLTLGGMYHNLLQDYARAAFWYRQAGVESSLSEFPRPAVQLADCYFRLGSRSMALDVLKKMPGKPYQAIKLLGDLGETTEALRLANAFAKSGEASTSYLYAGDACRVAGRLKEAEDYYRQAIAAIKPASANEPHRKRDKARAEASIAAIQFYTLDPQQVRDGTYRASSIGYEDQVYVEVVVKDGRIESVRVTQHREKQYYSSISDTPRKIVERQSVAGIDATSSATITSEAIINATAKALADGLK